jgi:protein-S-isoprenylcysteine O-methyltransferase Ste14
MPKRDQKLEFGGPIGTAVMILGLPITTFYFYFCLRFNDGSLIPGPEVDLDGFLSSIEPSANTMLVYLGWFGLQAALQAWAPGKRVEGTPLKDGSRLKYKMNGPASLAITMIFVAGLVALGWLSPRYIYDNFGSLLSSMMIFVLLLSIFVYIWGKMHGQARDLTGIFTYDFWMGTGHNPRLPPVTGFDLKFFCEARPGLILWMLVNMSFAYVQWDTYGFVSTSMWLVMAFQWMYILDYFWNEPAILTTMDIKHENFGYMLVFGDLVWVPMTYSIQAFYLIDHVHTLPWWIVVLVIAMNIGGWAIFRSVNLQKHRFRSDPEGVRIWGKKAEYIETKTGGKLLLSGFWGWSRHFNYVGDILMGISWSLPCLFGHVLPFFYPVYFAALLIHRERRDHHNCSKKYGEDWDRYCKRVRWRIIPGIY